MIFPFPEDNIDENLPHPIAFVGEHPILFSRDLRMHFHTVTKKNRLMAYTPNDLHCFIMHNMYHVKWFGLFDLSKETSST